MSAVIAEEKLYSDEQLARVDLYRVPQHVAIAMDGNRRWASKRHMPKTKGHWYGAEALITVVRAALELKIQVLTVYSLSTENMQRSSAEVSTLMRVFKANLISQKELMVREGVRLETIGDITKLPEDLQLVLRETKEATKHGRNLDLVLALNYGARDEIKRAIWKLIDDCSAGKISKSAITEEIISAYLDTAPWKDPDVLIRPSGESRISNFLLWQISYTEVFMTDVLWPDFCEKDLLAAILEYQKREVRKGR